MTTIEWTTQSGKAAKVTVSVERRIRHLGTDDHFGAITRDEGLEIKVEGRVEGMGVVGNSYNTNVPAAYRAQGVAAMVGKLGVMAPQASEIAAAIAAAEATPEYMEQEARRAAHNAEMAALDESRRRIENAL